MYVGGQKQCLVYGKHSLSANHYSEYYCDHREMLLFYQNRNEELHKCLSTSDTHLYFSHKCLRAQHLALMCILRLASLLASL